MMVEELFWQVKRNTTSSGCSVTRTGLLELRFSPGVDAYSFTFG